MATSRFQTTQYTSEEFVESAGAILFELSTRRVCLIHHAQRNEWLLAKGRRNVGEARATTAIREAVEETGYQCRLLPLTMTTRAPPAVEIGDYPDVPRSHKDAREPFMMTCRQLEGGSKVKVIWWYIACIDEEQERATGEPSFKAQLVDCDEAMSLLTFELDRDVVRKAVEIFNSNTRSGES